MYSEFKDKIVLITGGTTGIGKSTALAFASWGARVTVSGRNEEKGAALLAEASEKSYTIDFIRADISLPEEAEALVRQVVEKHGRLDIAFNNAGISGANGKVADCPIENFQQIINVNLNGVFYCMKYEIAEMLKNGGGAIVNNASVSGHKGYPGNPGYIASKHAVVGITKSAAMEYAANQIRVNAISPGLIRTPLTDQARQRKANYDEWVVSVEPLKRIGEPEEVAESVLWLCSSRASFVTGHILAVDGGILAC